MVRARPLLLIGLLALAAVTSAQSRDATSAPSEAPVKRAAAPEDPVARALAWLRRTGLTDSSVGRGAAERLVKAMPRRFAGLADQVKGFQKGFADALKPGAATKERLALAAQLWKLRGSLDLLSLLGPRMLHDLTGLDLKTLTGLRTQIAGAMKSARGLLPR